MGEHEKEIEPREPEADLEEAIEVLGGTPVLYVARQALPVTRSSDDDLDYGIVEAVKELAQESEAEPFSDIVTYATELLPPDDDQAGGE